MEQITDKIILEKCLKRNGSTNPNSLKNTDICQYLQNRYNDIPESLFSFSEVIQRIKNNIENRPVCKICGKPVKYIYKPPYFNEICSIQCANIAKKDTMKNIWKNRDVKTKQQIQEKTKQTCLEKYGCEYSFQSENNKKKADITREQKYGDKNYGKIGSSNYKEKIIKKYGYEFPQSSEEIKNKISKALSSDKTQLKMQNTVNERYGVPYSSQLPIIQDKIPESYKKHGTFNTSLDEKLLLDIFKNIFNENDILINYKSELYPYKCDFYIKSLDLYIEYQGSMYHNLHLFNFDNDKNELYDILKKCSINKIPNRYNSLIDTWVHRDVNKWEIACINNIKMLFIYPLFHKKWKSYKYSQDNNIKIELINYFKNLIYNNYKSDVKQLIIGENKR